MLINIYKNQCIVTLEIIIREYDQGGTKRKCVSNKDLILWEVTKNYSLDRSDRVTILMYIWDSL